MLKSSFVSILSLVGMISFEFWAFADDFQIEHANIVVSMRSPGKYEQLAGLQLERTTLSFDEGLSLKNGVRRALNAKKHELLRGSPINRSEIPTLTIEPVQIEFIEKPPFLIPPGKAIKSSLDHKIWLQTPTELNLTKGLTSNNYIVNILTCIRDKNPLVYHEYKPPINYHEHKPPTNTLQIQQKIRKTGSLLFHPYDPKNPSRKRRHSPY